jgi:hypothetical protein
MADEEDKKSSLEEQAEQIKKDVDKIKKDAGADIERQMEAPSDAGEHAEMDMLAYLDYLWMIWADFSLSILSPIIAPISPPIIIPPLVNEDGNVEKVFCINDEGYRLSTSRGAEAFSLGHSMWKFFNTIEKIIKLLVERLKTGGVEKGTEVRIAFFGYELGQRKAFESVLNLEENVVVSNYEPGSWGDNYMKTVLEMAERGYGLPPASPRTQF